MGYHRTHRDSGLSPFRSKVVIATTSASASTGRPAPRRPGAALLLAVAFLAGLAWVSLRTLVAERLTVAAQRDLQTIVDLVAVSLEQSAADAPGKAGSALLKQASAASPGFRRALERAEDENHRHIYFFEADGRTVAAGGEPEATTPEIVRRAIDGLNAGAESQGILFEPYADSDRIPAIGVWRWLPRQRIGIVAERPHDRFVQPLRWIDGLFAALALLTAVAVASAPWRGESGLRRLFRRGRGEDCGPYELGRLIGEGAMAKVYLARHRNLGRWVALKRLRRHAMNDELSARFDREARLASRLSHPNIVTVFDHGPTPDGSFYYAMEYVRGLTLTQWVEQHGPVPPARTVRLLRQICAAVGELHRHQLLHRDIKPDNIVAYAAHGDYDLVKLLDFGLIKDMGGDASRDLTRDVRVLGTPAFMAPERLLDPAAVDRRSDIYGIGCIGFYLLTGRKPFESARDGDLAQQVMHVAAPDVAALSVFAVPPDLSRLIGSALDKDMDRRPPDADTFARDLDAIAAAVPWRRERARLWWLSVQGDNGPATASATDAGQTAA